MEQCRGRVEEWESKSEPWRVGVADVATRYTQPTGDEEWDVWKFNASKLLGGHWYSTPAEGECDADGKSKSGSKNGSKSGRGRDDDECSWRFIRRIKAVDADCANEHVVDTVVAKNQACFDALPNPTNRSDLRWAECIFDVALNQMTKEELLAPFEASFALSDPDLGGCPDVPVPGANEPPAVVA